MSRGAMLAFVVGVLAACGGGSGTSPVDPTSPEGGVPPSGVDGSAPDAGSGADGGTPTCAPGKIVCGSRCCDGKTAIATSLRASCAITRAGGVKCWGVGALGSNKTDSAVPTDVVNLAEVVQLPSLGTLAENMCGLTATGVLKCWGQNNSAQLADGSSNDSLVPVENPLHSVNQITLLTTSGTSTRACAVTATDGVKCWGFDAILGAPGPDRLQKTPADVASLPSGVATVAWYNNLYGAGNAPYKCDAVALMKDGTLKCWGYDVVAMALPNGPASKIAAICGSGSHVCALTSSGGVICRGRNSTGELGDGTGGPGLARDTFDAVVGLASGVESIQCSRDLYGAMSCALLSTGAIKCWGNNRDGQLGNASTTDSYMPVNVQGISTAIGIATSGQHTCALLKDGRVQCWGFGLGGALGNGSKTSFTYPVDVVGL